MIIYKKGKSIQRIPESPYALHKLLGLSKPNIMVFHAPHHMYYGLYAFLCSIILWYFPYVLLFGIMLVAGSLVMAGLSDIGYKNLPEFFGYLSVFGFIIAVLGCLPSMFELPTGFIIAVMIIGFYTFIDDVVEHFITNDTPLSLAFGWLTNNFQL